ncbi:protein TolQ [Aquitalea sp. S1-19]|uniref:Tol-Pal system protein TolQ n=1 Tax=Craterilacuibacter sinensis TaxID=2686017 RepID=A0A845BL82_9NEIS|nr:protein TolQ [Craterilacuibacter sinensis]MCP9759125.1 protein TolQ [Aquitalea sp. S1-19]MXR36044.1 protein TolQ [Craterilacuibacter sinensis]RQW28329.1 protein TolQ [Rhodobacteraceae bacterium CH30]
MQEFSVVSLILHASLVVQLVMAGLVLTSVLSWALIFNKIVTLRSAKRDTETFERAFWSGTDLNRLYEDATRKHERGSMENIFQAGFAEFLKLRGRPGTELSDMMDGSRRAMRATAQRELDMLESHNAFLATVGSVSPYVGLFGTVWGIMHAFIGLGNAGQATLATVAPGIAEALIATAIGLFAAIPAVVAYNRFATDVDRLATRFDTYMEEFSNILQRLATR